MGFIDTIHLQVAYQDNYCSEANIDSRTITLLHSWLFWCEVYGVETKNFIILFNVLLTH